MSLERGEKGATGPTGATGPRGEAADSYHKWRWRALTAWCLIFSIVVMLALSSIRHTSASVKSLQETNCGLRNFLITAQFIRTKAGDIEAAKAYGRLIAPFNHKAVGKCSKPTLPRQND